MGTRVTKIPVILPSPDMPQSTAIAVSTIKQIIETREGLRGDPLDRFLTLRELRQLMSEDLETVISITAVVDHGGILGLDDDDHSLYLTAARASLWLTTEEIGHLHDVAVSVLQSRDVLTYNSSAGEWCNEALLSFENRYIIDDGEAFCIEDKSGPCLYNKFEISGSGSLTINGSGALIIFD